MTANSAITPTHATQLMKSKSTGRDYCIKIGLPQAYTPSPIKGWPFDNAPESWPVIYLLDADWYYGMVTDMIRPMAWCGGTSDAIVVGIGYPENADPQEAWREQQVRRNLDFTPIRDETTERDWSKITGHRCLTGDAVHFLQYIQAELIPFIEKNYRADPTRRSLVGHSFGGLFAAFTLLNEPDLFSNYIIGSPSLNYGNRFTFTCEEQFAERQKQLSANVYLSAGELEESDTDTTVTDLLRFAAKLQSRNYTGLELRKQIFADLNHCEVVAPGFQAGLKMMLKK